MSKITIKINLFKSDQIQINYKKILDHIDLENLINIINTWNYEYLIIFNIFEHK